MTTKTTTLLLMAAAALAFAQEPSTIKLSDADKLALARAETAYARAGALYANFSAQAQQTVRQLEADYKKAEAANLKAINDMKAKYKVPAKCEFNASQEVECKTPTKEDK